MILLASALKKMSVLSIQTGSAIAKVDRDIVDPAQLTVVAYEVSGPLITAQPTYLRTADIRELSDMGAIVDSIDELVAGGDVIKLDEIARLNFSLIGVPVRDEKRKKLGIVSDYTLDVSSFYIQQLTVRRPFFRSLSDTELLIHRTQIAEINNDAIIIHSHAKAPEPSRQEVLPSYVNPFRKSESAPDVADTK